MRARVLGSLGAIPAVLLVLAIAGCAGQEGAQVKQSPMQSTGPGSAEPGSPAAAPEDLAITYRFQDSSVPPPYHRSFTLTFDQQQARIVVDSYGDVLADETVDMDPAAWEQVTASLGVIEGLQVAQPDQGCTGGTGFTLQVDRGSSTVTQLDGYDCGGVNSEVSDQLAEWVMPVRTLFAPMDELAPE